MKKIIFSLLLTGITIIAQSQNNDISVEKSINGIQIGVLGFWAHNETKLTNKLALRSELGLDASIFDGSRYSKTGYLFTPVITLEPKWYYNLLKRKSKSKNISNNSGNFISLNTSFHPDWFVISNYDNVNVPSQISIIPTWGIRRNVGLYFNYETGIGFGYKYFFSEREYLKSEGHFALNLHLRVGINF